MSASALIAALQANNTGRDAELLSLKYRKMALSPFLFLRGADHLFYDALPEQPLFRDVPLAWSCGDLHLENFGSYKGDNRQVYFDINDYDEAALAPASWDLVRLLTSIQCGADTLGIDSRQALAVSRSCMDAYRAALADGKPRWVEQQTSTGLVNALLCDLQTRKRVDFLNRRTITDKYHRRQLKPDVAKNRALHDGERQMLEDFMQQFAAAQPHPGFYTMLDALRRVAGTGSLGLTRFVVLVEGKGSPDANYLLDIKECRPSALAPRLAAMKIKQPAWPDEASRVVTVQKQMQAVDHAFLHAVTLNGRACVLRGLQPVEDRVTLEGQKPSRLAEVAATMGNILAWDQLRASGRGGAASADALIGWSRHDDWLQPMLDASAAMTAITQAQWKACKPWLEAQ